MRKGRMMNRLWQSLINLIWPPQPHHSWVELSVRGGSRCGHGRFEKFSENAKGVLSHAQQEVQLLRSNYIGTEHILLGLLRESDSVAAKVLNYLGVELSTVRSKVEFIIGPGERLASGEIRFTDQAKKVSELAVEESRRSDHHNIDTRHLLMGLLREAEGIAAGLLRSEGVNEERVRGEVARISRDGE